MPAPSPSFATVDVHGKWRKLSGIPHSGSIRFTVATRVVSVTDEVIFPAGSVFEVSLDGDGEMHVELPATDDPDNLPATWSIKVEEKFDAGGGATYFISPAMAHVASGLNLRSVSVGAPLSPPASLLIGAAGGLALLDADGDVVDATGQKVTASGGGSGGGVSNIALDEDGVPYLSIGASGASIALDTDGVPYFQVA